MRLEILSLSLLMFSAFASTACGRHDDSEPQSSSASNLDRSTDSPNNGCARKAKQNDPPPSAPALDPTPAADVQADASDDRDAFEDRGEYSAVTEDDDSSSDEHDSPPIESAQDDDDDQGGDDSEDDTTIHPSQGRCFNGCCF